MNEWVAVDTSKINREVQRSVQGVNVKVSFSPYDVPRQWRGYREPNSNFYTVEFQYLVEEPTHTQKPSESVPIELEVGDNSKRIYKIRINVEKLGVSCDQIHLEVEPIAREIARDVVGAIKQFSNTIPFKLRERYKMPENLIFKNRREIYSGIAASKQVGTDRFDPSKIAMNP